MEKVILSAIVLLLPVLLLSAGPVTDASIDAIDKSHSQ